MNWFKTITVVVSLVEKVLDWSEERAERKAAERARLAPGRRTMSDRYRKASNDAGKESK